MKLFIDDVRPIPEGWVGARTYREALDLITRHWNSITEISFDHDLGEHHTGYDIALHIERMVHDDRPHHLPLLHIHSANPVGVMNLRRAFNSIKRIYNGYKS